MSCEPRMVLGIGDDYQIYKIENKEEEDAKTEEKEKEKSEKGFGKV